MIRYARVGLSAVREFSQAVINARDCMPLLNRGGNCLEELHHALEKGVADLNSSITRMNGSLERLSDRIREIENRLAELRRKKEELENKLSALEAKLANTSETLTLFDADGNSFEVPNPVYDALCIEIAAASGEIVAVELEIADQVMKLNHAKLVENQLKAHISNAKSTLFSLKEKSKTCIQLKSGLEERKSNNLQTGISAAEGLKKIEEIIGKYTRVKMKYTELVMQASSSGNMTAGITPNVFQNVYNSMYERESEQTSRPSLPDEHITSSDTRENGVSQHRLKYNREGKICEFDGRSYGGIYNTYEERLNRTALDNPIRGFYEVDRGESKYVPTGRSADGVAVIEILKQYGLDGIVYRNAEPDFEVCSEAVVHINGMTENRENYYSPEGYLMLGNFSQADIALAEKWNEQRYQGKTDWTDEDVYIYRKAKNLTWHEKCDTRTMVLVRSEINLFFNHSGGCSECRTRDASLNVEDEFDE